MENLVGKKAAAKNSQHHRQILNVHRLRKLFIWLSLVGLVAMVFADSLSRLTLIQQATAMQLMEPTDQPSAPGTRARNLIIPTSGTDGKWWIMHAEQMVQTGQWRIRHTDLDNSPAGREVHWSSGLMWLLVFVSWVMHLSSGQPQVDCVAWAAVWLPPLTLFFVLGGYGLILFRRYGSFVAACGVLIFGTCAPAAVYYQLGDCDHHGLVGWFAMASLLCLSAGGGGCVATNENESHLLGYQSARKWFFAAGVLGAAGLWISAATEIPILVGTSLGALVAGYLARRHGAALAPKLWCIWGVAGCTTSLGFYLLEYFPSSMGWRLEVNHPIYSFAWLGGGYLLYRVLNWKTPRSATNRKWQDITYLFGSCIFLSLPAALILSNPEKYFWVVDRFLLALHNNYILEFQPFFERTKDSDAVTSIIQVFTLPLLSSVFLLLLILKKRLAAKWMVPLVITIFPCLLMFSLGMREVRWLGIAMGLWSLLATLLVACYLSENKYLHFHRWTIRTLLILGIGSSLIFPILVARNYVLGRFFPEKIARSILPNVLARDVVHRLIQIGSPVILSGPTTSTELTYYGGVKTIGTLYWENKEGLKTAARVFSAESPEKARRLLTQHGISHILVFTWDDFTGDYQLLLKKYLGETTGQWQDMFITRLLQGKEIPQWIRPLYYPIPEKFEFKGESANLYAVIPDQSRFDWALNLGIYYNDGQHYPEAVAAFQKALLEKPYDSDALYYFALTNIEAGNLDEAAIAIEKAPPNTQISLFKALEKKRQSLAPPKS